MRLLHANADGGFSLSRFIGDNIPSYAILSHTWEADDQEVTLQDLKDGTGINKRGHRKIKFCGEQAQNDGLEYFWVDSCCIDQSSSAEVSTAINSMFRWYQNAAKCYVYLTDVSTSKRSLFNPARWFSENQSLSFRPKPEGLSSFDPKSKPFNSVWKKSFRQSRWFTRGWTLQELLAPASVEFFSQEGTLLGDKKSLEFQIQQITGIPDRALQGYPLSQYSVEKRISWMKTRETTVEEDLVYSLLGIFDIHMSLIYGEGTIKALRRLGEEIEKSLSVDEQCKLVDWC